MRFRLVVYNTKSDNQYDAQDTFEYLGDAEAIWFLWFTLMNTAKHKHVEVFNLAGERLKPELGISAMLDRQP